MGRCGRNRGARVRRHVGGTMSCPCCDHALQHAIRRALARIVAPIPPPSLREVARELQEALDEWDPNSHIVRIPAGRPRRA